MTRALLTVVTLAVFSISAWAEGYAYHARIEGMVCAFCAYNVGKTIGALPGVEAESVPEPRDGTTGTDIGDAPTSGPSAN